MLWAVKDTTICSAVADYDSDSGSVIFPAGQGAGNIQTFTFAIINDLIVESVEYFSVTGSVSGAAFPARFSNSQNSDAVNVQITDNDGNLLLCNFVYVSGKSNADLLCQFEKQFTMYIRS